MKVTRLYWPYPWQLDQVVTLSGNTFNHAIKVLRLKVNQHVELFDGQGNACQACLIKIDRRTADCTIIQLHRTQTESSISIHLGQAISRAEKMDWVIQKATELGVTEITPLWSERVTVQLTAERLEKRLLHWRQVAASACEQCGQNRVPIVHPPVPLDAWAESLASAPLKLALSPHVSDSLTKVLLSNGQDEMSLEHKSLVFCLGAEGGLSDREMEQLMRLGFFSARLGPRVLRTETATLAVLAVAQSLLGDLR